VFSIEKMDFVDIRLIGEDVLSAQSRESGPVRVSAGRHLQCCLLIGQQPDQSSGRSPEYQCDGDVDTEVVCCGVCMLARILSLGSQDYLLLGAKVEKDVSDDAIHAVLIYEIFVQQKLWHTCSHSGSRLIQISSPDGGRLQSVDPRTLASCSNDSSSDGGRL